ncbi:head-to-tail stopper [Streptomyces phage Verse]|uniref:Head-to-tail stopper n=2 Tax=Streptomyces phage Amela TaxID=1673877 RepID=A0A0K1Y9K1_9CAUD|nr:head closure Hc1 [Streptomyces phage Amela]AKY03767.1 head-to-tail stopper [Streptomyces phage Amela]AKY03842.1 head-to-tail stopper [Streptomyces phage Verse]
MSHQRRRGQSAKIWKSKLVEDRRGNKLLTADADGPHVVRAAFIPQRSAKAEVPGQQLINITRMIVAADLEDVTLWSRVEYQGRQWDIVSPPAYHHGPRKTRHWSIDIRERT